MRRPLVLLAAVCVLAGTMLAPASAGTEEKKPCPCSGASTRLSEGPMTTAEIVAGPFDLHRKYRSMEGPHVSKKFRISDLVASQRVQLPESMVKFVETSTDGPSMMAGGGKEGTGGAPVGLVKASQTKRELYWFKGISLQVLDENDKVMPTAEFICHLNLDVEHGFRNRAFPQAQRTGSTRLITLTQGQTDFFFPEGFAVPVASDEKWTFTFQAANRTTQEHRRLKHRCFVAFIKDSDLARPVKSLHWYNPYITVVMDKTATPAGSPTHTGGPDCLGMSDGANAPNATTGSDFFDESGRRLSGHWEVPVGTHTYEAPIVQERDPGFAASKRRVHAVWTHMHPLCTRSSLVQCNGKTRRTMFTATAKTRTNPGLEIEHIDSIITTKGIDLPAKRAYELEATYENTTGEPQDSMVALGIFCADEKFVRPRWVFTGEVDDLACDDVSGKGANGIFCGITSMYQRLAESTGRAYPLFNPKSDGPLLTESQTIELLTSAGKINLVLDPKLAPRHATQIYKLFKNHVLDGTPVSRYQPDYLIQFDVAETKADGKQALSKARAKLLRRLPLEVSAQMKGLVSHTRGVLTMARWEDPHSAVSSFSILLGKAPHLDNDYTIFGHVLDDAVTRETLERIADGWPSKKPAILSASETPAVAAR